MNDDRPSGMRDDPDVAEHDRVKQKAMEYSAAWRAGKVDGLGRSTVVAIMQGAQSTAQAIVADGIRLFGEYFETELKLRRVQRNPDRSVELIYTKKEAVDEA